MSPTQFLIPQELGWIQVSMELSCLYTFQEVAYIPDEQNWQRKNWFAEYLHLFYDRFCPLKPGTASKRNVFEELLSQ